MIIIEVAPFLSMEAWLVLMYTYTTSAWHEKI